MGFDRINQKYKKFLKQAQLVIEFPIPKCYTETATIWGEMLNLPSFTLRIMEPHPCKGGNSYASRTHQPRQRNPQIENVLFYIAGKQMSTIKFYLFGKFSFDIDGKLIDKIESHKAEELLGFLLLNRNQPYSREKLADLLWGEVSPNQANNYLRKALWQLQSALDYYGLSGGLLRVDGEWLQVNPIIKFWLDVAVFEDSFNQTRGTSGRDLDEEQAQNIQHAIEVYRGELLDGWYQD